MSGGAAPLPKRRAALGLLVLYAFALALLLSRHEMWRDELQAWTLARDSSSLTELWRNSRYEGHPLLWHLLLFPLAHAGAPPTAMQVVNWAIAVAAAAAVLLAASFPLWLRTVLVFSYFPLFEYGVIARNYALTMLAVWLIAVALARRSAWGGAAAGALAANASAMGWLLAPGVAATLCAGRREDGRRVVPLGPLALLASGALAGAVQMAPAADYEHAREWALSLQPLRLLYVARGFARALLPLPQTGLHFWESSALFPWPLPAGVAGVAVAAAACLAVAGAVLGVAWVVRRSPWLAAGWLVGAFSLLGFAYVKFPGAVRHQGFLWVWAVAVLWIAVARGVAPARRAAILLAPSLGCALAASAVAATWDWRAPFPGARCAARQLEAQGLTALPLVGGVDWATSGVSGFLPGGRLYYPASQGEGSFLLWNLERTRQQALSSADQVRDALARDRGAGVVLLTNAALPPDAGPCRELFACAGTIVADESLWGYLCRRDRGLPPPGWADNLHRSGEGR